jgi:hypothetical protein
LTSPLPAKTAYGPADLPIAVSAHSPRRWSEALDQKIDEGPHLGSLMTREGFTPAFVAGAGTHTRGHDGPLMLSSIRTDSGTRH